MFSKKYTYNIEIIAWSILIIFLLSNNGCAIFHSQKGEFIHDDISLHYTEKGKGEPVILIHGILVNSDLNWRLPGIKQRLSKNFHVIAFDLRGHGKSDKPHGVEMYGLNLVEDVCRVMDNLNIEKAHIVGYSLGGFIALKFATLYPERCYSVTVGAAGWEKATEENLNRFRNIYTAIRNEKDCAPLLELVGMKKQGLQRVSVAIANCYYRKTNDLDAIADLLESATVLEVKENDLKNCNVPILLIGGTADPLSATINELSMVLPNSHVVWIKKGTHFTTLFKKDFVKSIEYFLQKNNQN